MAVENIKFSEYSQYWCVEFLGAMATYMKYPKGAINHKVCVQQV